jgi:hypothetical protein
MILAVALALAPVQPMTFGNDLLDLHSGKPPAALANCLFGALRDSGMHATLASHAGIYRVSDGKLFQVLTNTGAGQGTWFAIERRPGQADMARYRAMVSDCL